MFVFVCTLSASIVSDEYGNLSKRLEVATGETRAVTSGVGIYIFFLRGFLLLQGNYNNDNDVNNNIDDN